MVNRGTVEAVVVVDGVEHRAEPSWVTVAPPKFAPTVKNVVTLYHEEASNAFKLPQTVQYHRDVASIFESPALCGYLNRWANLGHGPNTNAHFLNKVWQDKLKDNSPENAEFRLNLFGRFRAPSDNLRKKEEFNDASYGEATLYFMPAMSGDNGDFDEGDPSTWLSVSTGCYEILKKWRDGEFIVDEQPIYNKLEDVPLSERPKALTKAALEWCVGGPFNPDSSMNPPLRKEYQHAFSIFLIHQSLLPCVEYFNKFLVAELPLLPTNFVASSKFPISKQDLPKNEYFDWGQSSSRAHLFISDSKVTFWKVNTRRKFDKRKPPSYKVWIFEVEKDQAVNYFIWCEKGVEGVAVQTEIGFIFPQYLSIDDLSFLAPFVDHPVAVELGWKL